MNHKVLLADDSLTIQKVIKITLANEPYDLIDCANESEVLAKATSDKPSLVLLDFNLSEDKSGYDLCSELLEANPSLRVLMLFGTFDNIDEQALSECGASDKIIKPFDSNKLISLCRSIIEEVGEVAQEEELEEIESIETDEAEAQREEINLSEDSEDDEWSVESPVIEDQSSEDDLDEEMFEVSKNNEMNELEKSASDWGAAEVPGIIGESSSESLEIPGVISGDSGPKSKLVSLDELAPIDEDYSLELENEGTDSDEEIESLESQISDESEDELWQADEIENEGPTVINTDSFDEEDFSEELDSELELSHVEPEEEDLEYPEIDESESFEDEAEEVQEIDLSKASLISEDSLREALEEKIKPILEEYVRDFCRESIEKVAWEIIPDLAENLIKQELSRIADSVIEKN